MVFQVLSVFFCFLFMFCIDLISLLPLKNCEPHIRNKVNSDKEEWESKNVVEIGVGVEKNWHHLITNLNTQ